MNDFREGERVNSNVPRVRLGISKADALKPPLEHRAIDASNPTRQATDTAVPLQIEDRKQGKECICNDGFGMNLSCLAHDSKQQGKIERDYEPEQAYGTAHDFKEHTRFGGTREDY